MKQQYFILVLAHSLHGRLRRVHVPHQVLYIILALAMVGGFSIFGFVSSYARMALKVANYNSLRHEAEELRARYQNLQKVVNQTNEQLASLELLANEVTVAYGIKQKLEGPTDITREGKLVPTFSETVDEYNYLRSSNLSRFEFARRWHVNTRPEHLACGWRSDEQLRGAHRPVFGRGGVPQGRGHFRPGGHSGARCGGRGCGFRRSLRRLRTPGNRGPRQWIRDLLRASLAVRRGARPGNTARRAGWRSGSFGPRDGASSALRSAAPQAAGESVSLPGSKTPAQQAKTDFPF